MLYVFFAVWGGGMLYFWGENDINLYFKSPFGVLVFLVHLIFISYSFVSVLLRFCDSYYTISSKNKVKQV